MNHNYLTGQRVPYHTYILAWPFLSLLGLEVIWSVLRISYCLYIIASRPTIDYHSIAGSGLVLSLLVLTGLIAMICIPLALANLKSYRKGQRMALLAFRLWLIISILEVFIDQIQPADWGSIGSAWAIICLASALCFHISARNYHKNLEI